jgi:general secretion pathway protein E
MFFTSRRKDKGLEAAAKAAEESQRRATARTPVPPKAGAPVKPRVKNPDEAFSDSVAPMEVIKDLKHLPTGLGYFAFADFPGKPLPVAYEVAFALLRRSTKEVVLLRTLKEAIGRVEFEIGSRCVNAGLKVVERLCVTDEVLKALHDQHYLKINGNERKDTDVERLAFGIVESAVEKGASDIHIETRGAQADVYFRVHGERFAQPALSSQTAQAVMRVLYNVHADSQNSGTAWDSTVVQDTAVEHTLPNGSKVQLRFNTAPIYPSPNVQCTMRVLRMDGDQAAKEMEEVGYTPEMVAQIEEMLVGSTGLVLLVGPTNSGKSTSLQSFVKRIYAHRGENIKVVTIEDPVEYVMERACQMGVPRGKHSSDEIARMYKDLLGSTLRQDPDVALVGEIRTNEQAEPVKDMVLAGRKILSTLHAYEAMAVFPRLREIGVPDSLLTRPGFVSGVIYQRLVPVLCRHCSEPLTAEMVDSGRIRQATYDRVTCAAEIGPGGKHDVRVRSTRGCKDCNFTGITGRTPCAELLLPDAPFLRYVRHGDELGAKNYWHRTGINTEGAGVRAIAHAIAKMRRGLVDPNDIEVQIGKIEIDRPEAPEPAGHAHFAPGQYGANGNGADPELMGLGGRNSAFAHSSFNGGGYGADAHAH